MVIRCTMLRAIMIYKSALHAHFTEIGENVGVGVSVIFTQDESRRR